MTCVSKGRISIRFGVLVFVMTVMSERASFLCALLDISNTTLQHILVEISSKAETKTRETIIATVTTKLHRIIADISSTRISDGHLATKIPFTISDSPQRFVIRPNQKTRVWLISTPPEASMDIYRPTWQYPIKIIPWYNRLKLFTNMSSRTSRISRPTGESQSVQCGI